jgi:transcriptional regulator
LPAEEMDGMLVRQSAGFEGRLVPKRPWTMDKMQPDTRARFMRMILPCRMVIDRIDGTWKLGQNKPPVVRTAAAGQLHARGTGQEIGALAALMQAPPDRDPAPE